jgi:hypothetical protein
MLRNFLYFLGCLESDYIYEVPNVRTEEHNPTTRSNTGPWLGYGLCAQFDAR